MSAKDDIATLERNIRLLKVQYDQYFAGVLKLPPFELRSDVERMIQKHINRTFRQPIERFHFNSLVSRFNTFSELWAKCLRLKEEGRAVPGFPAVAMRPGANGNGNGTRSNAARGKTADKGGKPPILNTVVGGSGWDVDSLRPLYEKYKEALQSAGKAAREISFSSFSRQIVRKTEAVRDRSSCDEVRLRLTIDEGRVLFKALPLRRRKKTS